MPLRAQFLLLSVLLAAVPLFAESYVVPVWATALPGSDGSWWVQATATNPNAFPVSFRVARVFPWKTTPCEACTGEAAPVTLQPFASATIHPPSGAAGRALSAGAFEVTSSAPIVIQTVAYRPGTAEIRQRLDVARRWLRAGMHAVSSVERGGAAWRMNVFVTNPSDRPLEIGVWSGERDENEVRATVAPRSTQVVALPLPMCGAALCPFPTEFPPSPLRVELEADGDFLASVSSIDVDWAVFAVAEEAL